MIINNKEKENGSYRGVGYRILICDFIKSKR